MTEDLKYVLVTPARNEARFIEQLINCVVAQTVRPLKWIIVSDGSTDGTDDIVERFLADHRWIELIRLPERRDRSFAGKVVAFTAGYEKLVGLSYDIIGNLDADISVERDHFEILVEKFEQNPRLGVAGAPFREGGEQYDYRFTSPENVSGCCQLFRRACFESIGGYRPVPKGGIDLIATISARMNGWETRSFPERVCVHHRKMNSAMNRGLALKFNWGQSDYRLGSHPVWQIFRCVYQLTNRPYVVGGVLMLAGYYWALLSRRPRSVPPELAKFRGNEQMARLKAMFHSRLPGEANGRLRNRSDAASSSEAQP